MAVIALSTMPLDRTVIYIDTELKLDPSRIIQMAMERFPEIYNDGTNISGSRQRVTQLLDRVKVSLI